MVTQQKGGVRVKVIIAGSRTIIDYAYVKQVIINSGWIDEITEIVSGMARGVDTLGIRFAKENDIPVKEFPAKWYVYGQLAGYKRNREMAVYSDRLIAIHSDDSKGTKHMIHTMHEMGKPIFVNKC